jgi:phage tail protein X
MSGLTGVFGDMVDFLCFTLYQLTQCIPVDSTELVELK